MHCFGVKILSGTLLGPAFKETRVTGLGEQGEAGSEGERARARAERRQAVPEHGAGPLWRLDFRKSVITALRKA